MTDAEIIKGLEHWFKEMHSAYQTYLEYGGKKDSNPEGYLDLMSRALDLINRKDAEIERLQQNLKEAHIDIKEHRAEIERLRKENNQFADIGKMYSEIKAEAIKECLGKIEQIDVSESDDYIVIKKNKFNNLVKETVGE